MIAESEYWKGRDVAYASELLPYIRDNVRRFLPNFNACISEFEAATGHALTHCNSGWRPPSVNNATPGASRTSMHLIGRAGDAADPLGNFDAWLSTAAGESSMTRWGLWREDPAHTPGWAHLQDRPYRSWAPGKPRTFKV